MTTKNLPIAWFVAMSVAAVYLWAIGGWFHIELLPVSEYVRQRGWLSVFDWSVFDVSPVRLRSLSDLTEVADAILRPHTVWLFGHHASLSLSSATMAILAAVLFYGALRAVGLSRNEAIIFTGLFISTIGFLSCFVSYIRPAKRLALLGLCAILFLTFRYIKTGSDRTFAGLCGALFLSCFADEAGFVYWPVALLFLIPYLRGRKIVWFSLIPVVYILVAKGLLPYFYKVLGTSGARSGVIAKSAVSSVLGNLLSPDFYSIAFDDLSRSTATTFGVLSPPVSLPILVIAGIGAWALMRRSWVVFAASLALIGTSIFFSMLDRFPRPNGGRNYMGELTYYYHSPVAVLAVFWVAALYRYHRPASIRWQSVLGLGVAIVAMLNLFNFCRVNELLKILHTYPLAQLEPRRFDSEGLGDRFEALLEAGPLPQADGFRSQFSYYRQHPMGDASYADRLARTYRIE